MVEVKHTGRGKPDDRGIGCRVLVVFGVWLEMDRGSDINATLPVPACNACFNLYSSLSMSQPFKISLNIKTLNLVPKYGIYAILHFILGPPAKHNGIRLYYCS